MRASRLIRKLLELQQFLPTWAALNVVNKDSVSRKQDVKAAPELHNHRLNRLKSLQLMFGSHLARRPSNAQKPLVELSCYAMQSFE